MERLASDPHYFANPDKSLFQDIRRYFPITHQAQVAWAVQRGRRRSGRVHAGADRGRRVRRRRRPLPRDDAQGQAVPAHAAARARLLPVAPASRALQSRGLAARRSATAVVHRPRARISSAGVESHDTDKLIRQLSLVAFLMAERRALTARDVKGNVEGYSEMSDEAFARRFYSDRAELRRPRRPAPVAARRVHRRGALHAPVRALLPAAARARPTTSWRRCRPASTCSRASSRTPSRSGSRSRTSRSAGRARRRGAVGDRRARRDARSRLLAGDAGPAGEARDRDLQAAHGQVRATGRCRAASERERTLNPYALLPRQRGLVRRRRATSTATRSARSASRASAATSASRRGASATSGSRPTSTSTSYRGRAAVADRRDRRRGADRGRAPTRPGGSSARSARRGRVEDGVFVTEYASLPLLASLDPAPGRPRAPARARGAPPRGRGEPPPRPRSATRAPPSKPARERPPRASPRRRRAPVRPGRARSASACSRRSSPTCSRPAATRRTRVIPAARARRALPDPVRGARGAPLAAQPRQLRRRLLRRLRRAARRRGARRQGALRRHVPLGRRG